jgi:hypothetical protein
MRNSPKIRNNNNNSYSWSPSSTSTSPFKQNLNKSNQNSPDKTNQMLDRKRNNSGGYTSSGSSSSSGSGNNTSSSSISGGTLIGADAVAVPNPFGGSKYRDPPPADILPLPPVQWRDCNNSTCNSNINSCASITMENDIIQKLNESYNRLTAPRKG